jgi:adenine-specific DNA-methyltransferase
MKDKYTGSLSLEWYNKQKAILLSAESNSRKGDVEAPVINWVNKDNALYYEIDESEGRGIKPFWVDSADIRVREARPLIFKKGYKAIGKSKSGTLEGMDMFYELEELNEEDSNIKNILIKGDNLLSLNYLKKKFAGEDENLKVKCIYIDPPYNTGEAFESYEDNLAHSEWLTLLRDRLVILKSILKNDGSIWISVDDKESHYVKIICDEVFGRNNFIANIIWQKRTARDNRKAFSANHDHIIVYSNSYEFFTDNRKLLPLSEEARKRYKNPDNDKRGVWQSIAMTAQAGHATKSQFYELTTPTGEKHSPPKGLCWIYTQEKFNEEVAKGNIYFPRDGDGVPRIKKFLDEDSAGLVCETIWKAEEVGTNDMAKKHLLKIFGAQAEKVFDTPKPENLLERIIYLSTEEGDTILDCFGGSGTTFSTAHKMNRNWIGIEIGDNADKYIIPRLKNVLLNSDPDGVTEISKWQGGGSFNYYELGESIINFRNDGSVDFNWKLKKNFIEESFLLSYDYELITDFNLNEDKLFTDNSETPKIGIQKIGSAVLIGVINLCHPESDRIMLSYDELYSIYKKLTDKYKPNKIDVFTNKGIEIALETKPQNLEVIKVPSAIFSGND